MLTDTAVRAAKPREKPYKLYDEKGLFLIVYPSGSRAWRFRYQYGNAEKLLSLGQYPNITLKAARKERNRAHILLDGGEDPAAVRKAKKAAKLAEQEKLKYAFQSIAEEWLRAGCPGGRGRKRVAPDTKEQLRLRLTKHVFPHVGRWPIVDVTAPELLKILRRIESKGTFETAHRVRSLCSRVFRYGIVTGRAERDPAADLIGALTPPDTKHFPAITNPRRIGELLRAIDGYLGQPAVIAALKLAPLVFVRPSELRKAEWPEFDLDAAEWRIPTARMKMNREHVVPLSKQAVAILESLQPITGRGHLVFPGLRSNDRPISDNTINAALRRLDFSKDEMTGHGFRTMASTRLNEMGFPPDAIELQLAHKDQNKSRSAYNRSQRLAERRKMMQAWADYLEQLKADKDTKPQVFPPNASRRSVSVSATQRQAVR